MSSSYKVQINLGEGWATTLLTSREDIAHRKFLRMRNHKRLIKVDSLGQITVLAERAKS